MSVPSQSLLPGYRLLRSLSQSSSVFLCREDATGRLVVFKGYPAERMAQFQNEALRLSELHAFKEAPSLYFAVPIQDGSYVLGIQYCAGRSLLELGTSFSPDERESLAVQLQNALSQLHQIHRTTHGDISPRNILVDQTGNGFRIAFLDWEYASHIPSEGVSDYASFRGTVGYQKLDPEAELSNVEKDKVALNKVLESLGISPGILQKSQKPKWFSLWNRRM